MAILVLHLLSSEVVWAKLSMVQNWKLSPWVEEVNVLYTGDHMHSRLKLLDASSCISRSPLVWIDFQECASVSQNKAGERLLSNEGGKKKKKKQMLAKTFIGQSPILG